MTAAVPSTVQRFPQAPALRFDPALAAGERGRLLAASLPDPLRDLLAAGRIECRPRFADDGFDGLVETWAPPAGVTARHAALAGRALDEVERIVLAPAEPARLLGRILALLSHYPAKGHPPEVEQMIAMDWAEDIAEFPGWAIDQAARTWRRTRKWRPSIAEFRALCLDACREERALAERLRAILSAGTAEARSVPALRRMP